VETITTSSWLNSSRAYCNIFPPQYAATLTRANGGGSGLSKGFGAWGQYIQSDLQLNEAKAEVLRSEARFVHVCMAPSWCAGPASTSLRKQSHRNHRAAGADWLGVLQK
jgi:hypothetical protein